MSTAEAVATARAQLEELLGREVETVSSCSRNGDRGWTITAEAVELERIPPTTSMLGSYEMKLDRHGELVSYRRVRRYARNQSDRGEDER